MLMCMVKGTYTSTVGLAYEPDGKSAIYLREMILRVAGMVFMILVELRMAHTWITET